MSDLRPQLRTSGMGVRPTILIVEDQEIDALVLREMVRDLGDVYLASDGPSALALANQHKPDLVLLDIELDGMSGFTVCKAFKADPKLCDTAIIFVTAHVQVDNELRALETGGIGFIHKPLNAQVARAHIKVHLALHEAAKRLANHDALTGLPNRALLQDRTEQALQKARRNNTRVAMLLLDLDNFKLLNDSLGHSVGDALLKDVADRLEEVSRSLDTVSRQGGDEFVVLLPEISSFDAVGDFAERLLVAINSPFSIQGSRYYLSVSIGISLYPDDAHDAESLYRHADAAMYQAKVDGRNRYRFFSADIEQSTRGRHLLEQHMRSALDARVFEVFYQAKVIADENKIVGVEALLRWRGEDGELISPVDFIPLAEETGLIIPLGKYVLQQACFDAKSLIDQGANIIVSVNISAVQFREESFLQMVQESLQVSGLKSCFLELEITEGVLAKNIQRTQQLLSSLRALGVRIALDDFGTGYSSLTYLKSFPLDVLKIDQGFVRDMLVDKSDAVIVDAIVRISQAFELELVAEGVETLEQVSVLQSLGCRIMQGYLYSKPIAFEEFVALLHSGKFGFK